MEGSLDDYLKIVSEVREDTGRLMEMIDEALKYSSKVLSTNKAWELEMSLKYPEETNNPTSSSSNKRCCEFSEDNENGPKPCKQPR